jgi:hypothetical protein
MTTASPHTKPTVASIVGVIVGVLTLVQGFFGGGHLPPSAQVATVLGGTGLTAASVLGFIYHHAAWLKTVGPQIAQDLPIAQAAVDAVPGLQTRLSELEQKVTTGIGAEVAKYVPQVNVDAIVEEAKTRLLAILASGGSTANPGPTSSVPPPAAAGTTSSS